MNHPESPRKPYPPVCRNGQSDRPVEEGRSLPKVSRHERHTPKIRKPGCRYDQTFDFSAACRRTEGFRNSRNRDNTSSRFRASARPLASHDPVIETRTRDMCTRQWAFSIVCSLTVMTAIGCYSHYPSSVYGPGGQPGGYVVPPGGGAYPPCG